MFLNDPDRSPQLAWVLMTNLAWQAAADIECCGDIYAEMGIPKTLPRRNVVSLLKTYAAQFHPDKVGHRSDLTDAQKEEITKHRRISRRS